MVKNFLHLKGHNASMYAPSSTAGLVSSGRVSPPADALGVDCPTCVDDMMAMVHGICPLAATVGCRRILGTPPVSKVVEEDCYASLGLGVIGLADVVFVDVCEKLLESNFLAVAMDNDVFGVKLAQIVPDVVVSSHTIRNKGGRVGEDMHVFDFTILSFEEQRRRCEVPSG